MEIKYNIHTCATHKCGVQFGISEGFDERRRADKQNFYCPNGHTLVYDGDTEVQQLKRRVEFRDQTIADKSNIIADLQKQLRAVKRKPRVKKKV